MKYLSSCDFNPNLHSYDHLDVGSIKEIATRNPQCKFYVPLGNKAWFNLEQPLDSQGNDRVIELDWWESANIKRSNGSAELKFTCTPCQHFSGRGLFDRNKTLWASWCIEGVVEGGKTIGKVFFGGYGIHLWSKMYEMY